MIGYARLTLYPASILLGVELAQAEVPPGYRQVAGEYGIPPALFYAVALTESGVRLACGQFRPWPWTLNVGGQGRYFPTREAALAALQTHRIQGLHSIDIGLMQVNWRYHGARLRDPWQALDPYFNLRTAAQILAAHHKKTGDWWAAVGRYHSPRAHLAARYVARVKRHWQALEDSGD
jgi:soluble lytic murein transglycosylase-like protein